MATACWYLGPFAIPHGHLVWQMESLNISQINNSNLLDDLIIREVYIMSTACFAER